MDQEKIVDPSPALLDALAEAIAPKVRKKVLDTLTDVGTHMRIEATKSTLEYIRPYLATVPLKRRRSDLWDMALELLRLDGLMLEFGVNSGASINYFARKMRGTPRLADCIIHGFDSFEGLPEDWQHRLKTGALSQGGRLPKVESNVILHKGWFNETAPAFAADNRGDIALLHFDGDLYSSAKCVFDTLGPQFKPGSVILLDNYLNYFGWQEHEYKAFQEAVAQYGWTYRYRAFNASGWNFGQALVQLV